MVLELLVINYISYCKFDYLYKMTTLYDNYFTMGIFIDLKKAFDTVDHIIF